MFQPNSGGPPREDEKRCIAGTRIGLGGCAGHCPKCKLRFAGSLCHGDSCHCVEMDTINSIAPSAVGTIDLEACAADALAMKREREERALCTREKPCDACWYYAYGEPEGSALCAERNRPRRRS